MRHTLRITWYDVVPYPSNPNRIFNNYRYYSKLALLFQTFNTL